MFKIIQAAPIDRHVTTTHTLNTLLVKHIKDDFVCSLYQNENTHNLQNNSNNNRNIMLNLRLVFRPIIEYHNLYQSKYVF